MTCDLLRFIGHTEYVDRKGRQKTVAYWVMAATGGSSAPTRRSTSCVGWTSTMQPVCCRISGIKSWWPCSWPLTR